MLKFKLTKEEHSGLPADIQKEYKTQGEDFILDLDGYEDPGELRRAKLREQQKADDLKKENDKLKQEKEELENKGKVLTGDAKTIDESWKTKYNDRENEFKGKLSKRDNWTRKQLRDSVADKLAAELSDSPELIKPHILARLDADLTDEDNPATIVLDSEGKRSAQTVHELRESLRTDAKFAPIIRGSKASGAGGGGNQSGGAHKKAAEMTASERAELLKTDPAKFKQLFPQTSDFVN